MIYIYTFANSQVTFVINGGLESNIELKWNISIGKYDNNIMWVSDGNVQKMTKKNKTKNTVVKTYAISGKC